MFYCEIQHANIRCVTDDYRDRKQNYYIRVKITECIKLCITLRYIKLHHTNILITINLIFYKFV